MLHWPENHSTLLTIYFLIHIFQMMLIDFPNQTSFSCIGYQILLLTLVIHSAMRSSYSRVVQRREFCNPSRFHSVHATQAFVPAWHWHLWCPSAALKNAPKFTWLLLFVEEIQTFCKWQWIITSIFWWPHATTWAKRKERRKQTRMTRGKQVA